MITVKERIALEALWQRLRESICPDEASLKILIMNFADYENHPLIELRKLADLRKHLKPGISARTLHDLQVPIERALNKNVTDEHFVESTDRPQARETFPVRLVLNSWRSAFNVGSMFRTADGFGVEHIHLVGYTPSPAEPKVQKSSMGASVGFTQHDNLGEALSQLSDYRKVALETATTAAELSGPFPHKPTVFILGNERFGLAAPDLALCDEVRKISLRGLKNSLNVAAVGAIALHEWSRQWNP